MPSLGFSGLTLAQTRFIYRLTYKTATRWSWPYHRRPSKHREHDNTALFWLSGCPKEACLEGVSDFQPQNREEASTFAVSTVMVQCFIRGIQLIHNFCYLLVLIGVINKITSNFPPSLNGSIPKKTVENVAKEQCNIFCIWQRNWGITKANLSEVNN